MEAEDGLEKDRARDSGDLAFLIRRVLDDLQSTLLVRCYGISHNDSSPEDIAHKDVTHNSTKTSHL